MAPGRDEHPGETPTDLYFLIACLNEESVIGGTVQALRERAPHARIVIVDDGSDDNTAAVAREAGGEHVIVINRNLPNARQGKGKALNEGYSWILEDVERRKTAREKTLIAVMDADGRLSPTACEEAFRIFSDSRVGGVQLPVRIRNRDRFITRFQDLEFWGLSATSQFGRNWSNTVSLGGNAQFTRLSALIGLARSPWNDSLTEDLELTIALARDGWVLRTTSKAWVEQEGVDSWRRLVRQRTRWFQGHMSAARHIPSIWRSRKLSNLAALEMTLYLLVPWVLTLPWSVIFHVSLLLLTFQIATGEQMGFIVAGDSIGMLILTTSLYYLISSFPMLMAGYLYYRNDREMNPVRSILFGHSLLVANYVAYAAAWKALARLLRGNDGWEKTTRTTGENVGVIPLSEGIN